MEIISPDVLPLFGFGGFLGSLLSAGASLLGGVISSSSNRKIAGDQMDFQANMSNTSHQREVADLREAGLNPILSAKYGGASTPPGAAIPMQDIVSPAVNSALATRRLDAELENMFATNEKIKSDTSLNRSLEAKAKADALVSTNSARNIQVQNSILHSKLPGLKTEADIDSSRYGKALRYINRFVNSLNPFSSSAKDIRDVYKGF